MPSREEVQNRLILLSYHIAQASANFAQGNDAPAYALLGEIIQQAAQLRQDMQELEE